MILKIIQKLSTISLIDNQSMSSISSFNKMSESVKKNPT